MRAPNRFARSVFAGALLTVGYASAQTASPPPATNRIVVDVVGLRNANGVVLCELYASATGFPREPAHAAARTRATIHGSGAQCVFQGIAPGTYAIATLHDENGNGHMDTNFIGVPREGHGASNDARGHMGPPSFDDARFTFAGGTREMRITTEY